MTAQELTANIWDMIFVHDQPEQDDQAVILSLTTQALAQARREALEEAAKVAEQEGFTVDLPADKWDQGYLRAASNIANAIRAQAAKEEA
jgi:hypothetical protein